jgi:hypothetical protein
LLADQSARYAPADWARTAIALYRQHKADRIVAEVNNGGDMVESTIRMIDPNVSYSAVRASRAFLCPTWGLPVRPGRDGLGFAIDPVYRIETSWPLVGQALTRRLDKV